MGEVHQLILHQGVTEARRLLAGDKTDRLCVDAAYEVMADDRSKVGIAHAGFAMAALPHRRTMEPVWEREGGQIKLLVESGLDSAKQPIGIPYGAVARMILLYLQTQAVRTRSREIELAIDERLADSNGYPSRRQNLSDRSRAIPPDKPLPTDLFPAHQHG